MLHMLLKSSIQYLDSLYIQFFYSANKMFSLHKYTYTACAQIDWKNISLSFFRIFEDAILESELHLLSSSSKFTSHFGKAYVKCQKAFFFY